MLPGGGGSQELHDLVCAGSLLGCLFEALMQKRAKPSGDIC